MSFYVIGDNNTIMTQNIRGQYVARFENILNSLNSQLSTLEQSLDSIGHDHSYKQKAILDVLTEINRTKEQIEIARKNLECSKEMMIIRNSKVLANIPDHDVWNDCWYDEERKLFVTHNKYFMEIPDARDRSHQTQYTKETDDYGVVALSDKVEFRFGYPCVIQTNSNGQDVWFLLPTMTDNMLTKNIVVSRLRPKSQTDAILYETESEQWITIGTQGLILCEKENTISDELELYPKVPIEELRTLYHRN